MWLETCLFVHPRKTEKMKISALARLIHKIYNKPKDQSAAGYRNLFLGVRLFLGLSKFIFRAFWSYLGNNKNVLYHIIYMYIIPL